MTLSERHSVNDAREYEPPRDVRSVVLVGRDGVHVPQLHVAGNAELLSRPGVAVVGSREASAEGCALATDLVRELVTLGIVVVSGLAEGIDAAAHVAAMRAGGSTVAVIGTPLDRAYPKRHARLQEAVYREHLLVSPFAAGTITTRGHFPARNRVMARLSDATVLVEAGEASGTIHQVKEALAVRRPVLVAERMLRGASVQWVRQLVRRPGVFVWAVPGDVCHELERLGVVAVSAMPPISAWA
jgi:DNA processing protein